MDSADPAILKNVCLSISCLVVDDHSRSNDALLVLKKFAVDLRARLIDLLRTKSEFAKGNDERHHNQSTATDAELESSISLCLRRLCILSKRWSITRLLGKGDSGDADLDEICAIVSNYLEEALKERQSIDHSPEAQFDSNRMETAKIWSTVDSNVHAVMAESVSEGLNLILAMTAWRLNAEIELIDQGKVDYDAADIQNHAVIRLRDRLLNLIVNCHEHFIEPCILHNLTEVQKQFALAVQQHALRVSGDLRSLFPRKWRDSISPFLVACSLADDSILTGPTVRFVRSQTKRVSFIVLLSNHTAQELTFSIQIKYFEDGPDEKRQLINMLLYPVCRALGTNWKGGNRREAGCILAHISGSGKDAHELVLAMTRVFKKVSCH